MARRTDNPFSILVMGLFSYLNMPREQDPEINFNWVVVRTILPGALPANPAQPRNCRPPCPPSRYVP